MATFVPTYPIRCHNPLDTCLHVTGRKNFKTFLSNICTHLALFTDKDHTHKSTYKVVTVLNSTQFCERTASRILYHGTRRREMSRIKSYVYWTVHHLDSWIKIDQLDVTCFIISLFNAQLFRMLVHPSSGACDLFVELFHGLYCSVRIEVFALAKTSSKMYTTHKENAITIRHRSSQYLQKHAF